MAELPTRPKAGTKYYLGWQKCHRCTRRRRHFVYQGRNATVPWLCPDCNQLDSRGKGGNCGRGSRWIDPKLRLEIYKDSGWCCFWCSKYLKPVYETGEKAKLTLDHIVPRSKGGEDSPFNLVLSCLNCNSSRKDLEVEEWAVIVANSKQDLDVELSILFRLVQKERSVA